MKSLWLDTSGKEEYAKLEEDKKTKVCVIGAGMFGLMTAYYLSEAGIDVCVLEKEESPFLKTTGHTTAKITAQHGLIYHYLLKEKGKETAKEYWEENTKAIEEIERIVNKHQIDCHFERKTNYIYTTEETEIEKIKEECEALKELEIPYLYQEEVDLPFKIKAAVGIQNQAQFHPIQYLQGITQLLKQNKVPIYTNSPCFDIKKEADGYCCKTPNASVIAEHVVIATHYPVFNVPGFYFAKMYQSSSYVVAVDTKKPLPEGMYLNIQAPIYSFRTASIADKTYLLIGGADHKTGANITYQDSYGVLEQKAKELYPDSKIAYRWSTNDCITLDKIPYIGEFSNLMKNVYIGTGFNKWGMTSSHIAAKLISDKIVGKIEEFTKTFNATRFDPIENKEEVKNMVVDTAKSMIGKRIKKEKLELDDMKEETGAVIEAEGGKVGVYKKEDGTLILVHPVCTHLGCMLTWNDADKTWDCPCHGSRFDKEGRVLQGPAMQDLGRIEIEE